MTVDRPSNPSGTFVAHSFAYFWTWQMRKTGAFKSTRRDTISVLEGILVATFVDSVTGLILSSSIGRRTIMEYHAIAAFVKCRVR